MHKVKPQPASPESFPLEETATAPDTQPMQLYFMHTLLTLSLLIGTDLLAQTKAEPANSIKVMTFNIRYASASGANAWPKRREGVAKVIRDSKADLIGTQEGLHHQLVFLNHELKDHKWIGVGREGGKRGEFMAIFYRHERFEPLETQHFWLSDTPEKVGSASWGNTVKRMVTWVKFRDRATKQEFYFWNTHFDHRSQNSREKSAELILRRVNALKTKLPVILVGDFNAVAKANRAYTTLTAEGAFHDSFAVAKEKVNGDWNTFNSFRKTQRSARRIDWVLTRGPLQVDRTETVLFKGYKQIPSDHQPVTASLRLK